MQRFLNHLPFSAILLVISAGAMAVMAVYALAVDDVQIATSFAGVGVVTMLIAAFIGFSITPSDTTNNTRSYLISLFLAYLWLPIILALPMYDRLDDATFIDTYTDMVSAMTTTGVQVFAPDDLADSLHLWRATVAWFGGLIIWVAAVAILAPLNLGGYEVSSESREYTNTTEQTDTSGMGHSALPADRLIRAARNLAPVYIILTVLLAILLIMSGEQPLLACIHAMSVLSTSGITGSKGLIGSPAGFLGEMLIFIFLIFAITRRSFTTGFNTSYVFRLGKDRELRLAAMAVIIVPLLLFLRHWIGSSDGLGDDSFGQAMRALWGGIFTVLSFLTTTGFISDDWSAAEIWSGLTTPGLVFVGLAITGGGVATTAGGIKLLRVYALYKHGAREIEKLSYPNSVAGSGRLGRRIRREGAYVAWVFFMLFIVSLAVVMVALGGVGLAFEDAMILAIAALSTTGPLADVAGQDPVSYLYISDAAKLILSIAMIVGRMETLVLIALINPTYWRM